METIDINVAEHLENLDEPKKKILIALSDALEELGTEETMTVMAVTMLLISKEEGSEMHFNNKSLGYIAIEPILNEHSNHLDS